MTLGLRRVPFIVFMVWFTARYVGLDNFGAAFWATCRLNYERGRLFRRRRMLRYVLTVVNPICISWRIHVALLWNDLAWHFVDFNQTIAFNFASLDRVYMLSYGNVLSLRFTVLNRGIVLVVVLVRDLVYFQPCVPSFLLNIAVVTILRLKFNGPDNSFRCHLVYRIGTDSVLFTYFHWL